MKKKSNGFDSLIAKAVEAMNRCEYEEARDLYTEARSKVTGRTGPTALALEGVASAEIEMGNNDDALPFLREAIQLDPEGSYSRYFSLAQLIPPSDESVQLLEKGITLVKSELSNLGAEVDSNIASRLAQEMAAAHCSCVEILLSRTEEERDEQTVKMLDDEAEQHIIEAMGCCQENAIEPYLALANLRLSQAKPDEAKDAMQQVKESIATVEQSDIDVRYACGKQFAELDMLGDAIGLLESVVEEWDGHAEAWYILSMAHLKKGDPSLALDALNRLLTCGDGAPPEDSEGILGIKAAIQEALALQGSKDAVNDGDEDEEMENEGESEADSDD